MKNKRFVSSWSKIIFWSPILIFVILVYLLQQHLWLTTANAIIFFVIFMKMVKFWLSVQDREKERVKFVNKILNNYLEVYYNDIIISNIKKEIIWGKPLNEALIMTRQIIDLSYNDQVLINARLFLNKILEKIEKEKKGNKQEYLGEKELREKIEHLISLIPE